MCQSYHFSHNYILRESQTTPCVKTLSSLFSRMQVHSLFRACCNYQTFGYKITHLYRQVNVETLLWDEKIRVIIRIGRKSKHVWWHGLISYEVYIFYTIIISNLFPTQFAWIKHDSYKKMRYSLVLRNSILVVTETHIYWSFSGRDRTDSNFCTS